MRETAWCVFLFFSHFSFLSTNCLLSPCLFFALSFPTFGRLILNSRSHLSPLVARSRSRSRPALVSRSRLSIPPLALDLDITSRARQPRRLTWPSRNSLEHVIPPLPTESNPLVTHRPNPHVKAIIITTTTLGLPPLPLVLSIADPGQSVTPIATQSAVE